MKNIIVNPILYYILTLATSASCVEASFKLDKFTIEHRKFNSRCIESIPYPEFSGEDRVATQNINDSIANILQNYDFCSVNNIQAVIYDIKPGSKAYFSIRWSVIGKEEEILMLKVLNLDIATGKPISFGTILNPLAKNFMPEIVKLSQGNLPTDTSWKQFQDKITNSNIQFYIFNSKWHIIFNPLAPSFQKQVIDNELPSYLLKE